MDSPPPGVTTLKRKRGRPRKNPLSPDAENVKKEKKPWKELHILNLREELFESQNGNEMLMPTVKAQTLLQSFAMRSKSPSLQKTTEINSKDLECIFLELNFKFYRA